MVGQRRCRSLTHPTKDAMFITRAGLNKKFPPPLWVGGISTLERKPLLGSGLWGRCDDNARRVLYFEGKRESPDSFHFPASIEFKEKSNGNLSHSACAFPQVERL